MTTWGVLIVAKASVILALTLLAVRLMRQHSASVRHLALAAGFAALLVLPVASLLGPSVPIAIMPATVLLEEHLADPVARPPAAGVVLTGASSGAVPMAERRWRPTPGAVLTTFWLAGVGLFTVPLVVGAVQVRRLRRSGRPWVKGQQLVGTLAREAGVRRRVDVVVLDRIGAPAACGIIRPAILFPSDACTWPTDDIVRAGVHETEHLRRADCLVNIVARFVCALYWFHPLVWVAWRRLDLEAERACDDAVVSVGDATVYADQLVTLASRMASTTRHPLLAMANRNDLAQRVAAVLRPGCARGRVGRASAAAILLCASTVVMAIAPLAAVRGLQPPPDEQASADDGPTFEVASIRPSQEDERYSLEFLPSGRFHARAATVERLILTAYGLHASQVVGAPDWLGSERFTIEATAPDGAAVDRDSFLPLVRALLRDRFGLRTHTETRDMEVYDLVFARADRRLGPGLRPSTVDCEEAEAALQATLDRREIPTVIACRLSFSGSSLNGSMTFRYGGRSMSQIAQFLSPDAGRIVVDTTDQTGLFDMEVTFAPDPEPGSDEVSVFTAAQEQLGLRLVDRRREMPTLVIDAVERPSPN